MIRAMWTAATGMTAQQINVDTIAHNLANVNTNSFKRSRAEFADLLYQIQRMPGTNASNVGVFPVGIQIGAGVRPVTVAKEWMQGNMRQTNNELDLAIDGAGFFQVSRPDGTVMYTRNGSFKRDNVGNLVTGDGDLLNPVITIPSGALKLDIGQDGTVSVLAPRRHPSVASGADPIDEVRQSVRACGDGKQSIPRQFCLRPSAARHRWFLDRIWNDPTGIPGKLQREPGRGNGQYDHCATQL